ncbi:hypothetical protein [Gymnodinialimonas sp. 57CJ19]|uniref:hypothetical protein n=1 Tax=Gymnodinialimonas sp. 57CJ19 TaxID=3138498 RepID=UPI0031343A6A
MKNGDDPKGMLLKRKVCSKINGNYILEKAKLMANFFDERFLRAFKNINDSILHVDQKWDNVRARQYFGFAEGYFHGCFGIGIVFDMSVCGDSKHRFLAWLEQSVVVSRDGGSRGRTVSDEIWFGGKQDYGRNDQVPVFVDSIELIQNPKGVSLPGLCRVYFVEKERGQCFETRFFQSAFNGTTKPGPVVRNGEVSMLGVGTNELENGANREIKRGPLISDDIAYVEREREVKRLCHHLDFAKLVPKIWFRDDGGKPVVDITIEDGVKVVDVFKGPMSL